MGIGCNNRRWKFWLFDKPFEKVQNVKPTVSNLEGKPSVFFIAMKDISKDKELLFDYGNNSKKSQCSFPWLKK